jgi:hypothetical protein
MTRECRIGCLAWWAGVWWLALGALLHGVAWGAHRLRDGLTRAILGLLDGSRWCSERAMECAKDGGAL